MLHFHLEKLITNLKINNNKVLDKNFYQYYDDEFKKGKVNSNTEQNIYEYCYRIEKEANFKANIGRLNECENSYNPQVENKIEFFNNSHKSSDTEDKIRIKFNRSPYDSTKNKNNLCAHKEKEPTDSDSGSFQIDSKVLLRKQPQTAQTKELKSRFSSSANELNSSDSFKLCEFKKEFKRLPNSDLSQSMSKSINTLDSLDKAKNDQLTSANKTSEAKTLARVSLDKSSHLLALAKCKKIINKTTKEIKDSFSDDEIEYKKAQDGSSDDSDRSTKIEHVDSLSIRRMQSDDFKKLKQLIGDKKNIMRSETIRNNLLKELAKKTNDAAANSSNTNSAIIKAFMPRPAADKSLDEKLFSSSTSSTTNTSSSDSSSSSNSSSNSSSSSASSASKTTQTSSSASNDSSESDKNLYSRMTKGPNKTLKVLSTSINKMVFPFDSTDTKSSAKIRSQSSNQPSFSTMTNSSTTVSKVLSLNEKSCSPDLNENKHGRNFQISSEFKNTNKLRNSLRLRASTPKQYTDEVASKNRSPYSWPNQSLNNSFNQTDSNAKEKPCGRHILLRKTLGKYLFIILSCLGRSKSLFIF
jgi:hypothetical protein